MIIDRIPYFRQWKLQPEKVPTKAQMWKCTKAVLFSHFTIELPQVGLGVVVAWPVVMHVHRADGTVYLDLGIPSSRRVLWSRDASSAVPVVETDGHSNRHVLCIRGHVPLLCAPGVALW